MRFALTFARKQWRQICYAIADNGASSLGIYLLHAESLQWNKMTGLLDDIRVHIRQSLLYLYALQRHVLFATYKVKGALRIALALNIYMTMIMITYVALVFYLKSIWETNRNNWDSYVHLDASIYDDVTYSL